MDTFLTDIYHAEMEKDASQDLRDFCSALPSSDLELMLGLRKVAVDGKTVPSLPDGQPLKKCDACSKAPAKKTGIPEMPEGKTASNIEQQVAVQEAIRTQTLQDADRAMRVKALQAKLAFACADAAGRVIARTRLI